MCKSYFFVLYNLLVVVLPAPEPKEGAKWEPFRKDTPAKILPTTAIVHSSSADIIKHSLSCQEGEKKERNKPFKISMPSKRVLSRGKLSCTIRKINLVALVVIKFYSKGQIALFS